MLHPMPADLVVAIAVYMLSVPVFSFAVFQGGWTTSVVALRVVGDRIRQMTLMVQATDAASADYDALIMAADKLHKDINLLSKVLRKWQTALVVFPAGVGMSFLMVALSPQPPPGHWFATYFPPSFW